MYDLQQFLDPIILHQLNNDSGYNDGHLAKYIQIFEEELPNVTTADVVLVGVPEMRGNGNFNTSFNSPNCIRKQLYQLQYWHKEIHIADIGNIKTGATLNDTYAAVKTVVSELLTLHKTVILLGGSHDITLAQYGAYFPLHKPIEATCIDALINLRGDTPSKSDNFLMEMLTGEPNMIKHYNHIGFQSYLVHPGMLETMDKLHFDCIRVGTAKENIEEMEPIIRNTHLLSFDISAIKYSDAPANTQSPNGFTGEEACVLSRYAGLSNNVSTFGLYGYLPEQDVNELTAKQIAQMIWYFIDGKNRNKQEALLEERHHFNEYHTAFAEIDTTFLQSRKTNRWWMQMPDKKFIACSYNDYLLASQNDIPERWLRAQERG